MLSCYGRVIIICLRGLPEEGPFLSLWRMFRTCVASALFPYCHPSFRESRISIRIFFKHRSQTIPIVVFKPSKVCRTTVSTNVAKATCLLIWWLQFFGQYICSPSCHGYWGRGWAMGFREQGIWDLWAQILLSQSRLPKFTLGLIWINQFIPLTPVKDHEAQISVSCCVAVLSKSCDDCLPSGFVIC